MRDLLKQVIPHLTAKQKEVIKEDPDAFMKKFVTNPKETLQTLIMEALQTSINSTITPLQGQVRGLGAKVELQSFLRDHPEVTDEDVEPLMKMMDKYPEVWGRPDRMEVWFKLLKIESPEIGARTTKQKEELERSASDAKAAAGLGVRKSSTPKQKGDEFDELIDMWKDRNKYFHRE